MLHHVSLEIAPEARERCIEIWRALGFDQVTEPDALRGSVTWLQRAGTQIHLIHTEGSTVPVLGHAAVVVDDFDAAVDALRDGGHEFAEAEELWGERRGFAITPSGHRVEVMAAPPPS